MNIVLHKEQHFTGIGACLGMGLGKAYVRAVNTVEVPQHTIQPDAVSQELEYLNKAIAASLAEIDDLRSKAIVFTRGADDELIALLDAHKAMLQESRLIRGAIEHITHGMMNAAHAIEVEMIRVGEAFSAMENSYIAARMDDIREVARRLIRYLVREPIAPFASIPAGSILICDEMGPADMALIDNTRVSAIATATGGAEGHTAILARALGIPTVLGANQMAGAILSGQPVLVNGHCGEVVVYPSEKTLAESNRVQRAFLQQATEMNKLRDLPAVTRDGIKITLQANVELPIETGQVCHYGAEGVGLVRTEFLYMGRDTLPSEDEQYQCLKTIIEQTPGTATIRTLDAGGEKLVEAVLGELDEKATSELGLRGIRFSLARPELLIEQFRAFLRASLVGEVRILLPMVSSVSELKKCREILQDTARTLREEGLALPDALPPLGVMIEVPGAALAADSLAMEADFFSIGSNDLTMYTLAIDRGNEHVAELFDPLHPAVLRLIQYSAGAAKRHNIPISVCGEIAGNPRFTPLLTGLGITELSMTAHNIPRVKKLIRAMDMAAANRRAAAILDQEDSERIAAMLDDFNEEYGDTLR